MPVSAFAETIPKYETKIKSFLFYSAMRKWGQARGYLSFTIELY
jgi:hypothetical protein